MRLSHNLPLRPRIYPSFQHLYATLPQSTPPSQNIPPFQQLCATVSESTPPPPSQNIPPFLATICDPPRIYPSQNIPPFSPTICDPPRIYPSLPEYTPSLFSHHMRPSQNLSLPPRIHHSFQHLYTTIPQSTTYILGGRGRFCEGRI